jgi:cell division protein FtsW
MFKERSREILLVLFVMIGLGLIQVYSSSFIFAHEKFGDGLYFIKRQLVFAAVGAFLMCALWRIPTKWVEKYGIVLAPIAILLLLATIIPGIGVRVGGAKRWLPVIAGVRLEPCEIYKIALPFVLATFVTYDLEKFGKWKWAIRASVLGLPMAILMLQPDFGSFTMCVLVIATVVFVNGFPWKYLAMAAAVAAPIFYVFVMMVPYRRARIMAFVDPWQDPMGKGFQGIQSMLTFHSGGLLGVGIGDGPGKLFFLPEAHTDFTLAVFGEETGFIG